MNELIQEIEVRRANRALSEKKIPSEVVGRIMTAATYAPSCFNYRKPESEVICYNAWEFSASS